MSGDRLIDRLVTVVEYGAAAFLALVTALTFISVIMRYLFVAPIPDDFDFTRLLLGVAIFWGIACACWRGGHIQVDLLWNVVPRPLQLAIDLFATTLFMVFMAVFAWMMLDRVGSTMASGMTTMDFRIPIWPFHAAAWIGLALAAALLPIYLYRLVTRRQ